MRTGVFAWDSSLVSVLGKLRQWANRRSISRKRLAALISILVSGHIITVHYRDRRLPQNHSMSIRDNGTRPFEPRRPSLSSSTDKPDDEIATSFCAITKPAERKNDKRLRRRSSDDQGVDTGKFSARDN